MILPGPCRSNPSVILPSHVVRERCDVFLPHVPFGLYRQNVFRVSSTDLETLSTRLVEPCRYATRERFPNRLRFPAREALRMRKANDQRPRRRRAPVRLQSSFFPARTEIRPDDAAM